MSGKENDIFLMIIQQLTDQSGTDFSKYKRSTLERRLTKRMSLLNRKGHVEYLDLLRNDPNEAKELYNDLLIGVTSFFRDKDAFDMVRNCLKEILQRKQDGDSLRIWSVGCATGEEPYSLAILLAELLKDGNKNLKIQIFASDVDEKAISKARRGIYKEDKLKDIPEALMEEYFVPVSTNEREVQKSLKNWILFTRQDITIDPPFVKLDLVVCRNLLIYFDLQLQQEVLSTFHYSLVNDGYLFLGKSETSGNSGNLFIPLDGKHKIYKKNSKADHGIMTFQKFKPSNYKRNNWQQKRSSDPDILDILKDVLYNTYEFPIALVNDRFQIEKVHGSLRLYMDIRGGKEQLSILDMVNPELRMELRSLLFKVEKSGVQVRSHILSFHLFDQQHKVKIIVKPVLNDNLVQKYYLVIFEKIENTDKGALDNISEKDAIFRIAELEQELEIAREQLQTYTEELESNHEEMQLLNEELQSTNEELKSSNEELETSNEELQSSNEELQNSNHEMQRINNILSEKEEALKEAKYKWESLFDHSSDYIVILDNKFHIQEVNYVSPSGKALGYDKKKMIGTKFLNFFSKKSKHQIEDSLKRVIINATNEEIEASSGSTGEIYDLKFIPIEKNGEVSGIIAFTKDITEEKQYEEMLYFLNMASKELLSSLDLHQSLDKVTKLIVPKLADWFSIDILNEEREIELLTISHKDPEKIKWAKQYRLNNPTDLSKPSGSGKVIRTSRSEYYPYIPEEMLEKVAEDAEQLEILKSIGFSSAMVVPLRVKDKTLGAISFVATVESGKHYSKSDLLLAEEFAKLVALTLENIKLFKEASAEIEERKMAQQELSRSENQIKLITDGLPAIVLYITPDRRYKFINKAFSDFINKPKKDIEERTIGEVIGKETAQVLEPYLSKALKGKRMDFEEEVEYPHAGKRMMQANYIPDIDSRGRVNGIIVLLNDITEKRKQEKALENSELKFRSMVEALPHIAWTNAPDGTLNYLNGRWEEFTGIPIEDSLRLNWEEVLHPDDLKIIQKEWQEKLNDKKPFQGEARIREAKTGEYRWHLIKSLPVLDSKNNVMLWIGTSTNIDDQKKVLEKKDEFISIASHELKTPLSTVKGYLQLMQKDLTADEIDAHNMQQYAMKANNQANVLHRLISDLLDVSRIQSGKLDFDFKEHSLKEILDECIEEFNLTYSGHRLKVSPYPDLTLNIDKIRIEQVLQNILGNAVKYAPNSRDIDMDISVNNNTVDISIRDHGDGIPEEYIDNVFDKYFRANTSPEYIGGLGVGLYICSEIIKRHNGEINVESKPGEGSTFTFSLPCRS